jgi:hypothetical protein
VRAANAEQARLIAALQARVVELERRLGKDSSNSRGVPEVGRGHDQRVPLDEELRCVPACSPS